MSILSIIMLVLMAILFAIMFTFFAYLFRYLKKKTITEPKAKEDDIQYIDVFAKEIKSLHEQLSIQERLAVLGEVSAGIAHELRNPLAVIYGNAKLISKYDNNTETVELAKGIIKETEEINNIINELLKFAHNKELDKRHFDITKMIKSLVDTLPYKDKIELHCSESIDFYGDEQLIKQAVKNLIKNAHEAGDKIWITVDEIFVEGQKSVLIVVRDNGQGIDEEQINKIFQPFYSTKRQGLGMGLTLVQKIALQHNGFVKVESEKGKGSSFKMIIGR